MAYVAGLYTRASEASAAEGQRFMQFQDQIDRMSQRERDAIARQQQAALDKNYAGLVTPGSAPGFAGSVTGPKFEENFGNGSIPPQQPSDALVSPNAPPAAPSAGLSAPPTAGLATQPAQPRSAGTVSGGPTPPEPTTTSMISPDAPKGEAGSLKEFVSKYTSNRVGPYDQNTPFGQTALDTSAYLKRRTAYGNIINKLSVSPSQGVYDYFFTRAGIAKDNAAKRAYLSEALGWYQSDEVNNYLHDNPAALTAAQEDPLGFYKKYAVSAGGGVSPKGDLPTQTAAGLSPPTSGDAATGGNPSATARDTFVARAKDIPNVISTDTGQQLINRATQLGVDPAAAIAIFGIESNFGRSAGTSGAGAVGPLQVMPAQFGNLKKWFTNPENIQQYNIPAPLVAAAQNMKSGSDIDAGLLQLKYNELIGLPKNLWGAGYQGNADAVKKAGMPLSVGDGNISNADYNEAYIALYNEARDYVGVKPTVAAGKPTDTTFALDSLDREQTVYNQTYQTSLNTIKAQYDEMAAQRQRIAQQMAFAQQSGFANRLPEYQRQLDALDNAILGVNTQAQQVNIAYMSNQENFNLKRLQLFSDVAIFKMRDGEPGYLSDMWSRATGQDIQLQLNAGTGGYNVYINGKLDRANVPPAQIENEFKLKFDSAYAAEQTKLSNDRNDQLFKHDLDMAKTTFQKLADIEIAKINQTGKNLPGWGTPQKMEGPDGSVTGYFAIGTNENSGKLLYMMPKPGVDIGGGLLTAADVDLSIKPISNGQAGLYPPQ